MLRLRSWAKWQNAIIGKVMSTRRARIKEGKAQPDSEFAPLSMQSIAVASVLDTTHFGAFADIVGGDVAESYFVRVCQFVANGHGLTGECPVRRDRFAAVVLNRPWHIVPKKVGEKVYDALLSSGIAEPLSAESCGATRGATGSATGCTTGRPLARAFPALPVPSPPSPAPDGGETGSVGTNGHAKPLSASDRAVFDLVRKKVASRHPDGSFDSKPERDLFERVKAAGNDPDQARLIIDEFTPRWLDEIKNLRMTYAMGAKARA